MMTTESPQPRMGVRRRRRRRRREDGIEEE
jgi:hypothetical protein